MDDVSQRVYLSAPLATESDIDAVVKAMRSGWIAPVGPDLTAFESEMAAFIGVRHAVALASGTAGLQLALKYVGVRTDDVVLMPTVTFAATAFAACYEGASPAFIDVDHSWNLDPEQTTRAIEEITRTGRRIGAAVIVDLYGTPANYDALLPILTERGIPIIEDAAEGAGASVGGRRVGSLGEAGVLSFNGNKIMTTSGGGMIMTDNEALADKVRFWSTQSREPVPWYEHREIGFNFRMSNILAALGRSQLQRLPSEVARRRALRQAYRELLDDVPTVHVQEDPVWGTSNAWLTVVTLTGAAATPGTNLEIIRALERQNIEARPVWKPLHQQAVFASNSTFLTGAADRLFADGICLPSGPDVDRSVAERVVSVVRGCLGA